MTKRFILEVVFVLLLGGCNSSSPNRKSAPPPISAPPADDQALLAKVEQTKWTVTTTSSPIDGTKTVILTTLSTVKDENLIIRSTGKKLEIYVSTGDIVNDENASVRIKFDGDAPSRQTWGRSADYMALFSPQPHDLLAKLQKANRFYIEYSPYQKVPQTIVFDVKGLSSVLPQELAAAPQQRRADVSALKSKIAPHVHLCAQRKNDGTLMYPGQWCWTDPDAQNFASDLVPFPSKEEAIKNALEMAHAGLASKRGGAILSRK